MIETWKRFENTNYEVSTFGNVRNLDTNKILAPFLNNGYLAVDLFDATSRQRHSVHRMVAIVFIDNREGKDFVNHIDGDKTNNRTNNLEWVTPSENSLHAVAIGLSPIGEEKTLAKLSEADVLEIQTAFENGAKDFTLAERYGVTSGVISSIRLGKTWKHVSGKVFAPSGPNPVKKLCSDDIPVIRQLFLDGFNDAQIGREFKVARGTINQIRQGKTWINY